MHADDVEVRLAGPPDARAVAELLDRFNREFESPTPGVDVLEERLSRLLPRNEVFALLARDVLDGNPRPVGLALVTCRPNVWYEGPVALLDELYVVPTVRDRGIGAALIASILTESVRRGISAIEIEVDEPDSAAQRFYRRHGFTDHDPDTGDRALVFRRDLAP